MKTSIFDMNFVLPPMIEMTEVMKDMPKGTALGQTANPARCC
tara:strand:+ start:331 stop:456 length:126 start_codon:yes stop_codon:yes gene_type:complete